MNADDLTNLEIFGLYIRSISYENENDSRVGSPHSHIDFVVKGMVDNNNLLHELRNNLLLLKEMEESDNPAIKDLFSKLKMMLEVTRGDK